MITQNKLFTMILFVGLILVTGLMLLPIHASAEEMPVPPDLQVALFKKIFLFDNMLKDKEEIKVFIVYDGASVPEIAEELKKEFEQGDITPIIVEVEELENEAEAFSVVYILPDVEIEFVREICIKKSLLSISGDSDLGEEGEISVAVGEHNEKPKIMINMNLVAEEGHEFSADILKLAKVITLYHLYAE